MDQDISFLSLNRGVHKLFYSHYFLLLLHDSNLPSASQIIPIHGIILSHIILTIIIFTININIIFYNLRLVET